jgi:hypothetical protein
MQAKQDKALPSLIFSENCEKSLVLKIQKLTRMKAHKNKRRVLKIQKLSVIKVQKLRGMKAHKLSENNLIHKTE